MGKWYLWTSLIGILLGIVRWVYSPHTAISFEEACAFVLVTACLWAIGATAARSWKRDPKPVFAVALLLWLFFSVGNGVGYLLMHAFRA